MGSVEFYKVSRPPTLLTMVTYSINNTVNWVIELVCDLRIKDELSLLSVLTEMFLILRYITNKEWTTEWGGKESGMSSLYYEYFVSFFL